MAEKGLGTGLGALFGVAALDEDKLDCVYLPISKVEPCPEQPRHNFDPDALSELADSIAEHGVISPLTVRRLASGQYQIIAGERRWRAARQAGLDKVPCLIMEADDRSATVLALVENLQREDLDPIEEAAGYEALTRRYGFTQEQCAQRVGKSRPAVANSLRLLALPEEVRALVSAGKVSAGHARALLGLNEPGDLLPLARDIAEKGLSVRQTEGAVRLLNQGRREKAPSKPESIYARALGDELTGSLGRRVRIIEGRKKGRIELEYYDSDDRERLIDALRGAGKNTKE